jgi:hypothetical protein
MNTNTNLNNKYKDNQYPLLVNIFIKKLVYPPIYNFTETTFNNSQNLFKRVSIKIEINGLNNYKYQELYLYRNNILIKNLTLYDSKTTSLMYNKKRKILKKTHMNEKKMKKKESENDILNKEIERLKECIVKLQKKIKPI